MSRMVRTTCERVRRLLNWLFGCSHTHYSFPMTLRRNGKPQPTYTVCLNCGREFYYDWERMARLEAIEPRRPVRGQVVRYLIER